MGLDSIKGLKEYVQSKEYRKALGLPKEQQESYELLAQGEYNRNYYFVHPVTEKELLLRVNCGVKCIWNIKLNMKPTH